MRRPPLRGDYRSPPRVVIGRRPPARVSCNARTPCAASTGTSFRLTGTAFQLAILGIVLAAALLVLGHFDDRLGGGAASGQENLAGRTYISGSPGK
jgi:hypothetical protein